METFEIPLFPLRTVLFPGAHLPLRIFEQRYLTMVRECASNGSGFGVCLITEGEEAVAPVRTAQIGTLAQIIDWYTLEDGLLGVTATGATRFATDSTRKQADGLLIGRVHSLSEPAQCAIPEAYFVLSQVLGRFMERVDQHYPEFTPGHLQDATWVGYRLSELLPLTGMEKQHLLELEDPIERLQTLLELLPRFQSD